MNLPPSTAQTLLEAKTHRMQVNSRARFDMGNRESSKACTPEFLLRVFCSVDSSAVMLLLGVRPSRASSPVHSAFQD